MDLPSVLGGLAQGFVDFGKSAVDLFGTGGAAFADLIQGTGTKNQDDFRKWLYQTDSVQDAAAKGLGTALNGAQTISDYVIPGGISKSLLFNAGQGALGGLADEFKTYGENYDLGRAGQRALVSAGAAGAGTGLANALKNSGSSLLQSGLAQGASRGALSGAINQGGYAAIDGGDIAQSALQGAGMGALLGGATGAIQDFMPRKQAYMPLTEEEKTARIANAKQMLEAATTPERRAELQAQISRLGGTPENTVFYHGQRNTPSESGDTLGSGLYVTSNKDRAAQYADGGNVLSYDTNGLRIANLDNNIPDDVIEVLNNNPELRAKLNTLTPSTDFFDNSQRDKAYALWKELQQKYPMDQISSKKTDAGYEITYPKDADLTKITGKDLFRKLYTPEAQDVFMGAGYDGVSKTALGGDTEMAIYRNAPKNLEATLSDADMAVNAPDNRAAQFDLLQKTNPMTDDYHTGIRSPEDIYTLKNIVDSYNADNNFTYPDFTLADAQKALANGNIDVYSSKPIETGAFISPSKMMATDYAGGGKVYTKNIPLRDFAFIESGDEGNYLPMNKTLDATLADADMAVNSADKGISVYTSDLDPKTKRAIELISNQTIPADNELYNRIDPATLPQGYEKLRNLVDNPNAISADIEKKLGKNPYRADIDELLDYLYPNEPLEKRVFNKSLSEKIEKNKKTAAALGLDVKQAADDAKLAERIRLIEKIQDRAQFDAIADIGKDIDVGDDIIMATQDYRHRGIRTGYPGALDTALSERLDIAPGNTIKITDSEFDWTNNGDDYSRKNLGRYTRNAKDIAIREGISGVEGDISTLAHERLHSFQNEAKPENKGRYSKEVADAYNELSKDLKPFIKDKATIEKLYGGADADYYARPIEQESRMLQTYLDDKGYTDKALSLRNKFIGGKPEWGNEINPAFDKFIDKLRDLSKRGVALPALAGLVGGGAVLEQILNSKDEDKKKTNKRSA